MTLLAWEYPFQSEIPSFDSLESSHKCILEPRKFWDSSPDLQKAVPWPSPARAATAEKRAPGRGNNEQQSSEVDSEQPKLDVSSSLSLLLFTFVTLSPSNTHKITGVHAKRARALSRSNDLRLLAQFVPFRAYFCSRQIRVPVITTPFHPPVLNHTCTIVSEGPRACARVHESPNKHGPHARKTLRAHKQAGVHAHEQAWITLELFEEWGMKPLSPNHLSPPELFYSYQRIGAHQLFTSVEGGTRSNTELQPELEKSKTCGGQAGRQTDGGRQPVQITKEFIGQSAILLCPSVKLPGRPACTRWCPAV